MIGPGGQALLNRQSALGGFPGMAQLAGQLQQSQLAQFPQLSQLPGAALQAGLQQRSASPQLHQLHQLHQDASDRGSTSASELPTPRSSLRVSASPSVSSAPLHSSRGGLVAGHRHPSLAGSSTTESAAFSEMQSTSGSLQSGTKPFSPRSELSRVLPRDELPRFGAADADLEARPYVRRLGEDGLRSGPPPEPGSVEAIIQEFTRSMKKVGSETSRDLRAMSAETSSTVIREAWAHGVSGAIGRSGLTTPIEGSADMGGLTGLSLTTVASCPWIRSPRGTPRDASAPSLKAAAMAVVGHGASGLRSGLLSGKNSPRGSPPRSPRQTPHTDSARSLMLTAPWQQYKSVAKRLQQHQACDSQSSTPRMERAPRGGRDREGGSLQPGDRSVPTRTSHIESPVAGGKSPGGLMHRAASEPRHGQRSFGQDGGGQLGEAASGSQQRTRQRAPSGASEGRGGSGASTPRSAGLKVKVRPPEIIADSSPNSSMMSDAQALRCVPNGNSVLEEPSENGGAFGKVEVAADVAAGGLPAPAAA